MRDNFNSSLNPRNTRVLKRKNIRNTISKTPVVDQTEFALPLLNVKDTSSRSKIHPNRYLVASTSSGNNDLSGYIGKEIIIKQNKFRIIGILGRGGFGSVFSVLLQDSLIKFNKYSQKTLNTPDKRVDLGVHNPKVAKPKIKTSRMTPSPMTPPPFELETRRKQYDDKSTCIHPNYTSASMSLSGMVLKTLTRSNFIENIYALKIIKTGINGMPCLIEAIVGSCLKYRYLNHIPDSEISPTELFLLEDLAQQDLDQWICKRRNLIGGLQVDEKNRYIVQILLAINFMHQQGFIHGDLKPKNILLNHGIVKLGDFGLIKRIGWPNSGSFGTIPYSPPELLLHKCFEINDKIDVWALGCCMFKLYYCQELFPSQPGKLHVERKGKHLLALMNFFETHPFFKHDHGITLDQISNCLNLKDINHPSGYKQITLPPTFNLESNKNFNNLIRKILICRHEKRPTIINILDDPFFADIMNEYSNESFQGKYETILSNFPNKWKLFQVSYHKKYQTTLAKLDRYWSRKLQNCVSHVSLGTTNGIDNDSDNHKTKINQLTFKLHQQLLFLLSMSHIDLNKFLGRPCQKSYLDDIYLDTCYWMAYKLITGRFLDEEIFRVKMFEIFRMERLFCQLSNFRIDLSCTP